MQSEDEESSTEIFVITHRVTKIMLNIRLHHQGIRFFSTLYSNTIRCCKNHFAKCELAGVRSKSKQRNAANDLAPVIVIVNVV